jgi:hypothetical protein
MRLCVSRAITFSPLASMDSYLDDDRDVNAALREKIIAISWKHYFSIRAKRYTWHDPKVRAVAPSRYIIVQGWPHAVMRLVKTRAYNG